MNKSPIPIAWAMALLLVAGCELVDLPIAVTPAEPQLVIASAVGPEQTLLVTVSRSFSALSATDVDSLSSDFVSRLLVDSAGVFLSYEGVRDTLQPLFEVPGLYGGSFTFLGYDQLFTLTVVDARTGETVTATTPLLAPATLEAASLSETVEASGDTTTVLTYAFTDLPGESYYVLHAYNLPPASRLDSLFADTTANPFFPDEALVFYETLIADQSFDTPSIADTVRLPFFSANDTVAVTLSHISEGYYRFLQARRRTGGLVASLANEPVNHPTNVEGGRGFFTAHQPRAVLVEKQR